jgi:hypothetical protein
MNPHEKIIMRICSKFKITNFIEKINIHNINKNLKNA